MGTNLLSDSRGLVTGQTRDEAQKEVDHLRIEALQHLAAMSIDSNLRHASRFVEEVNNHRLSRTPHRLNCYLLALDCKVRQKNVVDTSWLVSLDETVTVRACGFKRAPIQ